MAKIIVVDYDPSWPAVFERLRGMIWPHIEDVAMGIEHVGSTSVPGLSAKPIIDMTIVVRDAPRMRTVIERLEGIGYRHRGDLGVPGREAFERPAGGVESTPHHLYACVLGNEGLRNHLAVRDFLRRDAAAAEAYGRLKRELAMRFPEDIDGYVEGKTAFLLEILEQMGFEAEERERIRGVNRRPG